MGADLYKVYIDDLLRRLQDLSIGGKIGSIRLNAAACADDVILFSNGPHELQILINIALQYTYEHMLQPLKSVVIPGLTLSRG